MSLGFRAAYCVLVGLRHKLLVPYLGFFLQTGCHAILSLHLHFHEIVVDGPAFTAHHRWRLTRTQIGFLILLFLLNTLILLVALQDQSTVEGFELLL